MKRIQKCRMCGCTDEEACQPNGCVWVENDLCSACCAGDAIDEERERVRIILEYLINKNSHPLPRGVDFEKFFDDIQDFEDSLIQ